MDSRDMFLQSQFPTLPMSKFADFERLAGVGHRFLVGSNGLALEVRRPWLYMRKLAMKNESGLVLPYGEVSETFELLCGQVPRDLLWQFAEQASKAGEIETAAWITWSEHTRKFRYRPLVERKASSAEVVVERPQLEPGEHLVVDLHSHGSSPAYFSSTDNQDDRGCANPQPGALQAQAPGGPQQLPTEMPSVRPAAGIGTCECAHST